MSDTASIVPLSAHLKTLYASACRTVCLEYGLSQTEFDILDVLSSDIRYDTAAQISRLRYIKKANVSTAVDRLICKGLIDKRGDKRDKRVIHLMLTESANSVVSAIKGAKTEFSNLLRETLTEPELKTLTELIEKLVCSTPAVCGEC